MVVVLESYPSAEIQSVYSTTQANWAVTDVGHLNIVNLLLNVNQIELPDLWSPVNEMFRNENTRKWRFLG